MWVSEGCAAGAAEQKVCPNAPNMGIAHRKQEIWGGGGGDKTTGQLWIATVQGWLFES